MDDEEKKDKNSDNLDQKKIIPVIIKKEYPPKNVYHHENDLDFGFEIGDIDKYFNY